MPTIGNIMDAVDLLQIKAVELDEDRCVRATNRNSKCEKCSDACIANAIHLGRGSIEIDHAACVNCGCCVPVCPDNALNMAEPTAQAVLNRAEKIANPRSRSTIFACSRIAAKNIGDPDQYAEVPCLGYIGELQLLELIAHGLDDIILVDGNCETCKLGKATSRIDETVNTAGRLLDACGSQAIITRQSSFPDECLSSGINMRGEGRRGLLRQTTSYIKTVAGNVAKKTIEDKLQETGATNGGKSIRQKKGVMHFQPEENYRLIDAMEKLLSKKGETPDSDDVVSTRHFGNVFVDPEKCSGCGMCVLFCPTYALKYEEFEEPADEELRYCDFQASDCIQCMLCKDVCLRDCLEVSPKVSLDEILDFEPRLIEIARPKKTTSLAGLGRRNI